MSFHQDFQHRAILSTVKVVPKVNVIFRTPTITKRTPAFTSTDNTGIYDLSLFTGQGPRGVLGVDVLSINLSGSLVNIGAQNAGFVVGAITITTSPPGGVQNTPVVLGGPDAALFQITNGGIIPCNLITAVDIPAGSYSITLSVS